MNPNMAVDSSAHSKEVAEKKNVEVVAETAALEVAVVTAVVEVTGVIGNIEAVRLVEVDEVVVAVGCTDVGDQSDVPQPRQVDVDPIANLVSGKIQEELASVESRIARAVDLKLQSQMKAMETRLTKCVVDNIHAMKRGVIKAIIDYLKKTTSSTPSISDVPQQHHTNTASPSLSGHGEAPEKVVPEQMAVDDPQPLVNQSIRRILDDLQASSHNQEVNVEGNVSQQDNTTKAPTEHERTEILNTEDAGNKSPSNQEAESTSGKTIPAVTTSPSMVDPSENVNNQTLSDPTSTDLTDEEAISDKDLEQWAMTLATAMGRSTSAQIQTPSLTDDGVLTCLYVDAHCQKGLEACKFLTQQVLPDAAKQLCLKFYRYITQNNPLNHRQQQS
ncbi:unnamed protein product [Eruca vesicaria subsp. sativa]|uniref:FRIGIDA-like protein n=1 Tax=Eruca vesicaria subsp. sativa TaxID=29727 RepID=A0ABC8JKJ4_ERUVS|nr:unnamed protein product [Eruca vesicaria subsp. sativa]